MRTVTLSAAAIAGLLGSVLASGSAWAQDAPQTCSEAHTACTAANKKLTKECEAERQWCLKTGTFADPKSKLTRSKLQKQ